MTEKEWCAATDTREMLLYLEGSLYRWGKEDTPPKASDRQIRLFACAMCRCIWELFDGPSRQAVEVAEQFADAHASVEELGKARDAAQDSLSKRLPDFPHVSVHHGVGDLQLFLFPLSQNEQNWKQRTDDDFEQVWGYNPVLLRSEMSIYRAFEAAIDAASSSTWGQVSRAGRGWCTRESHREAILAGIGLPDDDPRDWFVARESEEANAAHLLRHIAGNPFRPYPAPARLPSTAIQLAQTVYQCGNCTFPLHDALLEAGHPELADHFRQEVWHPKGCWALDLILGKE
jgi:hypothetical protein